MRLLLSSNVQRLCFPTSTFRLLSSAAASTKKTATTASVGVTPPSRRRQFQQIPVDPKLLQYIREQNVSKPIRQNRSRKMDRYIGAATRTPAHLVKQQRYDQQQQVGAVKRRPPLPFGPSANPVRVRHSIRATDQDISGSIHKLNPKKFPTVALCGRSNVGVYNII